jgi:hypothetical protein
MKPLPPNTALEPTRMGALDLPRVFRSSCVFWPRGSALSVRRHVLHRIYIVLAFVLAVAATVLGWSQSLNYKITPLVPLALWFPLVVILGARELAAVGLSLIQYPLFATAFSVGIRRWPVTRVIGVLGLTYVLLAATAFVIVRSR